jgi:hypothetical protein
MAQSPYQITGVSTIPTTVDLGGIFRRMQASVHLSPGSTSSLPGSVLVSASAVPGTSGSLLVVEVTDPDPDFTYSSSVVEGFFRHMYIYTNAVSSGNVNVTLYFDGSGWPA